MRVISEMPPLDHVLTVSRWLAEITGGELADVQRRLLAECRFVGHNVCEAAREFGLVPHVWNERMLEFYASTDAFLFETVAWNSTQIKQQMRSVVCEGLTRRLSTTARVLCFGDGMGFDSAALARCGFDVTCYEVSGPCLEFAKRLFALNQLNVRIETSEHNLGSERFDAIVCLDVLEHLPDPVAAVKKFSGWLNESGFLVAHAPFYHVDPTRPTHLRSNRRFSGVIEGLYGPAGFHAVETGGALLNPVFLQALTQAPTAISLPSRARIRLARAIVKYAKYVGPIPRLVAAIICKPPVQWRRTLEDELRRHQA